MIRKLHAFLTELQRRNVYRAAATYVIVGLGVMGAAELILGPLGFEALMRPVVMLTLAGFPVVIVLSWLYDFRKQPDKANGRVTKTPGDHSIARSAAPSPAALESPIHGAPEQDVRFCQTVDGVRIAYSVTGSGPTLIRVLGWFTHLAMEWRWPELRFFWESLAEHFTVIRYDGRGTGLSDPWQEEFTEEDRLRDLDAVIAASGCRTVSLLGISEGGWTAALYAREHPSRIRHLVFYGCYSRGVSARPGFDAEENQALMTLMRKGWGKSDPALRRLFTHDFFPVNANPELLEHFDELQRVSADADTAVRYVTSLHERRGDGKDIFEAVETPSLVLHRQADRVVPLEEGRRVATLLPDASFQVLRGTDHYFPVDLDAATEAVDKIVAFVRTHDGVSSNN